MFSAGDNGSKTRSIECNRTRRLQDDEVDRITVNAPLHVNVDASRDLFFLTRSSQV